ncbi:TonB family protein [Acinetobacter halotolerans]|uniref:TonB family protein n=1 Tax=Acinetobacter halotolerans TaxID=1752076 RepID=A0A4Q6XBS2_9GAMM|nr:TonB family protein [Acinetobacter halotolerans]RZF55801.1 TonB family protein [Acinetobacter halotolerans]
MKLLSKTAFVMLCVLGENSYAKNIEFINVDSRNLKWKKLPQISFNHSMLQGHNRDLSVVIDVNEKGEVVSSRIKKSSYVVELDTFVVAEIKKSSFYPYEINGKYYPMRVEQPFKFYIDDNQTNDSVLTIIERRKLIEERLHKEIIDLWEVPIDSENLNNVVSFVISRNNSIDLIQVHQSSGSRDFDLSTRQAIRYSTLVKKLTNDEKDAFFGELESKKITISFRAN